MAKEDDNEVKKGWEEFALLGSKEERDGAWVTRQEKGHLSQENKGGRNEKMSCYFGSNKLGFKSSFLFSNPTLFFFNQA